MLPSYLLLSAAVSQYLLMHTLKCFPNFTIPLVCCNKRLKLYESRDNWSPKYTYPNTWAQVPGVPMHVHVTTKYAQANPCTYINMEYAQSDLAVNRLVVNGVTCPPHGSVLTHETHKCHNSWVRYYIRKHANKQTCKWKTPENNNNAEKWS